MGNKFRFILNTIIAYAAIALIVTFLEVTMYATPNFTFPDNSSAYILLGSFALGLVALYFISERKRKQVSWNFVLLASLAILFITGTLMICLQQTQSFSYESKTMTAEFSTFDKFGYIFELFIFLTCIYLVVQFYERKVFSSRSLHWAYYVIMIIGLFGIVYSLITEMDKYILIFTKDAETKYPSIESIFGNENVYGFMLMFACFSTVMVRKIRRHWFQVALFILYFVAMIFSTSLMSIFCTLLLGLFVYVWSTVKVFNRKHFVRGLIRSLLPVVIVVASLITIDACANANIDFFVRLKTFIFTHILRKDYSTFNLRSSLWNGIWVLVTESPLSIIFGRGYGVGMKLTDYYCYVHDPNVDANFYSHAHNFFFDLLINGGFLAVSIFLIGCGYYIRCIIYNFKHGNKEFTLTSLVCVVLLMVYGIFENLYPLKSTGSGVCFGLLFVLPPILFYKQDKEKFSVGELKKEVKQSLVKNHSIKNVVMNISLMGIAAGVSALAFTNIYKDQMMFASVIVLFEISVLSFVLYPHLSLVSSDRKHFRLIEYLFLFIPLIAPVVIYILYMTGIMPYVYILWLPILSYLVAVSLMLTVDSFICSKSVPFKSYIKSFRQFNLKSYFIALGLCVAYAGIYLSVSYFVTNVDYLTLLIGCISCFGLGISFVLALTDDKDIAFYNAVALKYEIYEHEKERGLICRK